jgi:hypothetical protein
MSVVKRAGGVLQVGSCILRFQPGQGKRYAFDVPRAGGVYSEGLVKAGEHVGQVEGRLGCDI